MDDYTRSNVLELAGQGYTCAQIVVLMGLRIMGRDNPDLVRALSALAMGASSGSLCGALTGGLCLVGLYTGKGIIDERPVLGYRIPLGALIKWFTQDKLKDRTEPTCRAIFEADGQELDLEKALPTAACGDLVGDTFLKALELIQTHGLDPTQGREL
ncbi:MAG: C-GCAxxG-C-C family protein [Deltaproteobacteria bacterium]|jgi:hypothetical protein|nr:C-GCAxxG-C-C family protein [Deltaproteobacteria bacterium]